MRRIAVVACFLLLACVQAGGQFFQSVDEWLQKQQQKHPFDTNYIYRPQERWRLRTTAKVEGESVLLGGGYAYNFVPSENWLIHIGLTETVGFLNSSAAKIDGIEYGFKTEVPAFVTKGSAAVLYYWGKWYTGVYANYDSTLYLGENNVAFLFSRDSYNANLTLGVRF